MKNLLWLADTYGNNSKKMSIISFLCSVFSGAMTCISILDISNLQVTIFQSIVILFCAVFENYLLKQWNKYYNDFFEKDNKIKKITLILISSIITIYTAYSVKTNFDFWNKSKIDMCGRIIISGIFDLMAICFAFISDEYFYLNFNKLYFNASVNCGTICFLRLITPFK